ncbi:MAG: dinitrogenase iron-molybdenum cofactor biosynthesis protein [Elusimicrobia bacterium]|nr:dinitrogenase iron-molybdenum cofactor biosynthesis protein [Elusimicrobiota bacterium]
MKVAVTAAGGSLSAQVAPNFGRCEYFMIVDTDTMKFEPVKNPAASMMGGAGPVAAKLIKDKGAQVLLTGVVGPNAQGALQQYGIEVLTGVTGTVKEAVENYAKK